MTTSSTPTRCPFAESCWMGGGSYACVKTPPFCDEPLIPKESMKARIADAINAGNYGDVEVHAEPTRGTIDYEKMTVSVVVDNAFAVHHAEQSVIKQGELF